MTSAIPPAIREYAAIAAARHATVPPDLTRTSQRTGVPREDGSDLTAAYALAQHLAGGTETDATDATYRAVTALNHTIHPIEAAGGRVRRRRGRVDLRADGFRVPAWPRLLLRVEPARGHLQPADLEMFLRLINGFKRAIASQGETGAAR